MKRKLWVVVTPDGIDRWMGGYMVSRAIKGTLNVIALDTIHSLPRGNSSVPHTIS